jgi:hypothetical protein
MKSYMPDIDVITELQNMLKDTTYSTQPGYSIDGETYPDHSVPFVKHHMHYLERHPQVDPAHYLSNLRLMLKVR